MKQSILFFFAVLFLFGCDNSSDDRNPYLIEARFTYDINLNLPQYGSLVNPGNALYIGGNNVGIKGIIVYNQGFGNYIAWEASCPNHTPNNCSTMTIEGGTNCKCSCDDYLYSLVNGVILSEFPEGSRPYALLNYRVTNNGSTLRVYN